MKIRLQIAFGRQSTGCVFDRGNRPGLIPRRKLTRCSKIYRVREGRQARPAELNPNPLTVFTETRTCPSSRPESLVKARHSLYQREPNRFKVARKQVDDVEP